MMTLKEIEIATAEQLADELAAACECTEDWERLPIGELRERMRRLVRLYTEPEPEPVKLTDDDKRMLGELATRDEAGQHFIETHSAEWLDKMERLGIITISRPTHPSTGIPYSQEYWSVGIMPGVPGITDDQGYLIDD
jgi:hypothetical protein